MKLPGLVLFVCTGNTCRSPMAEGIYNALAIHNDLDSRAISAGVSTQEGMPASFGAQNAMAELGIDISLHSSQPLTNELLERADAVLCMLEAHAEIIKYRCPQYADKVMSLFEAGHGKKGDIRDPFGGDENTYHETALQINAAIMAYLDKFEKEN